MNDFGELNPLTLPHFVQILIGTEKCLIFAGLDDITIISCSTLLSSVKVQDCNIIILSFDFSILRFL
jgi:hypothetical protein